VFVEYGEDTGYGGELLRVNGLQWCRGGEWLGDMCCWFDWVRVTITGFRRC
jgi:hypothetical protein